MPPTADATTGFFFHSASETVRPKPSRRLFWITMVEARCSALTFERRPGRQLDHSNVRMVIRFTQRFLQHDGALGIVGSAAAREDQLAIEISLHDTVRANHANRVLQAVRSGKFA